MARRFQRARNFARRAYHFQSGARQMYRRSRFGKQFPISLPYIGGVAAGYLAPRIHPMQDIVITALAVLPVRLPMRIKPIAQGYVLGMIARQFLPNVLGLTAATGGGDFA